MCVRIYSVRGAFNRANEQRRFHVKTFAPIIVVLAGLISAQSASAAIKEPTDAELRDCFRAHAQLMEKPGLRNWVICWRAQGYLMGHS